MSSIGLSNILAWPSPKSLGWFGLLAIVYIGLDFFFILLNIGWRVLEIANMGPARPAIIEIGNDYGIPEVLNFTKCLCVALVLIVLVPKASRHIWAPVGCIFLLLFADDALRLHENAGEWIGNTYLTFVEPGTPTYPMGQLIYAIGLAVIIYGTVLLSLRRALGRDFQVMAKFLFLLLALGFFGVVIDFFNSAFIESFGNAALNSLGSLVENGAEMIIFSLCVWTAGILISPEQ